MGQTPAQSSPGDLGLAKPEGSPFCIAQRGTWVEVLAKEVACSRTLAEELLCGAVNRGQEERGQKALQALKGCHPTGKGKLRLLDPPALLLLH